MSVSDHKKKKAEQIPRTDTHSVDSRWLAEGGRKEKEHRIKTSAKKKRSIRNIGKKRREHATRKLNSAIT